MNLYGFTDSLATIARQPNECTNGHSASRVSDGLCLGCLLQAGLTEDEDCGSESLDALLSDIEILGHQPASQEPGDDPRNLLPIGTLPVKFSHPVKYSRPWPSSFRRSK